MSDPFFDLTKDSSWNACIGVQGHVLNYVEGYLEAAIELADVMLHKKLYDKRDTLVLPILYNARHAVELTQKFVIATLHKVGALPQPAPNDHDIKAHWTRLMDGAIGDEELRAAIRGCEPYVESLSRIDDDGQALRYAVRQDGQQSMADKALANIVVIRKSLDDLAKLLSHLKERAMDYADERATGTFTKDCSRRDLFVIARLLPKKADWTKPEFDAAKDAIRTRFALSKGKFSDAVDAIKACRETNAIIGEETALTHLTDDEITFTVDQWSKCHPADRLASELGTDYSDPARIQAMFDGREIAKGVSDALLKALTPEKIADLQTLFYMGRDCIPAEFYDRRLATALKEVRVQDLSQTINHLMEKTNFKMALAAAAPRLGRLRLAERLQN